MRWLSTIAGELFALFVDDVPFSAAIAAWVAIAAFGLPALSVDARWDAPLLAAGCALILVVSARNAALRHRRKAGGRRNGSMES